VSPDPKVRPAAVYESTDERLASYYSNQDSTHREPTRRWKTTDSLMESVQVVLADFDGSMSTRQVYYSLVSRGAVQNIPAAYERVQRLLVQMRKDGEIDQDRIVDRGRMKHQRGGWDGAEDMMEGVRSQYRRNLWASQRTIVMVALEKAALEGVFAEVVDEYGAALWTLRGFASEAFTFDWATEIQEFTDDGHAVHVVYFGDADPSGLEIEHAARSALTRHGADFTWERGGLLFEDFDTFDLVKIPIKVTDSRTRRYRTHFGDHGAELDALPPYELRQRVNLHIEKHINREEWMRMCDVERAERATLEMVSKNWPAAVAGAKSAA
jgi:hypothetical protein